MSQWIKWVSPHGCAPLPFCSLIRCVNGRPSQPPRRCGAPLHKADSGVELSGHQAPHFQCTAPACVGGQRRELRRLGWAQVWPRKRRGELCYHYHRNGYDLTADITAKSFGLLLLLLLLLLTLPKLQLPNSKQIVCDWKIKKHTESGDFLWSLKWCIIMEQMLFFIFFFITLIG